MTDPKYRILLKKLHESHVEYKKLLAQAENEYERRFGTDPSEVDNDDWIDTFHISPQETSLEKVTKDAMFSKSIRRNYYEQ